MTRRLTDRDYLADALGALTGRQQPELVATDRDLLTVVLDALEARGCQYQLCPGPAVSPVSYGSRSNEFLATCYVCREVWRLRRRLHLPKADWHPGAAALSIVRLIA
jgi:hypothetical protein